MKAPRNILVVSRSTRHCRQAVETGISLARHYDAKLFVMHVIHDPVQPGRLAVADTQFL